MSKDDRFPHLSLNDDDDEIVIQAGATSRATARESVQSSNEEREIAHRGKATEPHSPSADAANSAEAASSTSATDTELADENRLHKTTEVVEVEADQAPGSQADRDELSRHEGQKFRRADEFSMQTTEDDLHASGPFTRMRAIILIVGVLALTAWIIWWVLR